MAIEKCINDYGVGDVIFKEGSTGRELWVSDGTAAGTFRLADAWPGPDYGNPTDAVTQADGHHAHELPDECDGQAPCGCNHRIREQPGAREQQQCIALAFYQGLSHAEVATHLHQPLGSVKSWVRRGLLALKSCLQRSAAMEF